MYPPPSDRFLAALRESHVLVSVVELHWPDGRVDVLPHTGGSVAVDRGASVRRTATVELHDAALLPFTAADFLAIAGCRVRIHSGIHHPGSDRPETVPVFTGRLDSIKGDPDTGPVTITASGLEAIVTDDKFQTPYSTRSGTAAVTAIRGLIEAALPDAVLAASVSDEPLGVRTWDAEADRWAAVQELATAVGAEAYADADGIFIVEELPDLLTAPVAWEVAAGEGGALIAVNRGWSRQGIYNVVVANGENTEENTPPVTATAEDDDPTSPTWVDGPFGRVPMFHSSPTLTTATLAQGAANKLLRDAIKPAYTADLTALPNPLLAPGDVLRAVHGDGRRTLYQVQSFSLDLSVGGSFTLDLIGGKEDG